MSLAELTDESLVTYLAGAIARAAGVYGGRPVADPAHALALGEAVALFNLADEFGLIAAVRQQVNQQVGRDVYRDLSEAMKRYYLGGGAPAHPPGPHGRDQGRSHRPPPRRNA